MKNNGELVAVAVARSFPTTGITTARKTTATDGGCSVYYGGQAPSSIRYNVGGDICHEAKEKEQI